MISRPFRRAIALVLAAFVIAPAAFPRLAASPSVTTYGARNVILMIADGCGFNQTQAGSLYRYGQFGGHAYQQFPFHYAMSTFPYNGHGYDPVQAWDNAKFYYVLELATDSAAAGTAMATGFKAYNNQIGLGPDGRRLQNAVERAEARGKATGIVTTVHLCDATPAAFVAHNSSRSNLTAIAQEMLLSSALDVLMGGGNPWFNDNGLPVTAPSYAYVGGSSTWAALQAHTAGADADGDGTPDPWTLIQTRAEFQALMSGDAPARVCGVPQIAKTTQQLRSGNADAAPYVVPPVSTVPSLTEMALGALNVLDEDPDGLFLMIEGGAIDWASHSNQSGRMIEEQLDFADAVSAVAGWVEAHSSWQETLLVVTADHETGYLWGPGSNPGWQPLVNHGAGALPSMTWYATVHSNSLVPLYARGDAATGLAALANLSDPVRGAYLDNAELGAFLLQCLDTQPPTPTPTATPTAPPTATPTSTPDCPVGPGVALTAGWNLVSLLRAPTDTSVAAVLCSIQGNLVTAFAYDASAPGGAWHVYVPGAPPYVSDLAAIDERMGLWVNVNASCTLTCPGTGPGSVSIPLRRGWNLVSYPMAAEQPVAQALASIDGKYDLVYGYDPSTPSGQWLSYAVGSPPGGNTLTSLEPGGGYWVEATEDCTLTY